VTDKSKPRKVEKSHLLVVEGNDEKNFFEAMLRLSTVSGFQVMDIGGKDKLRAELRAINNEGGFDNAKTIGIVRDGDGNNRGAFDSVCSALKSVNLPFPTRPLELCEGEPRISIMIMPPEDVESGQMLEDLCLAAVADNPNTRTAMYCVDEYFSCLGEQADIAHKLNALPKARLHAFLASRPDPDLRLGEAAQRGYIPLDSPVFEPVVNFLRQLTAS
jgi:hypothetical protein